MTVYVVPFNPLYVENLGCASADEFRDWVSNYGDRFPHSLRNPQKGDVVVFAWIETPGRWIMVGDAIVRTNHASGSREWCDCRSDSKYQRHFLTGGIRLFPRNVDTRDFPIGRMGEFVNLTSDQYQSLMQKTVDHWPD